ncbi:D-alanyl-D-alanine carboxypeptidase/D-alanyl-D-alanine-endopeptidase [Ramlibacter sp. USB13]|uniref:D-alanyl-D-alanine carboxypeptidase/D-alanyl-D-alanine-endopeptidase n=1 Tax=Ramlibacter cellulosilyticus TaxID=2764187 RepID=A0A923MPJ6_9BURK|nr:D-alanyl-D-alanine carboxypeptidase/D-alanyl-D-alanine-endopeptidase [Ramlibacter cellulosilyticus]MBC5782850.1 D-alanyl-D-alanine carboxypeptidase/D-alanyl-D-alanine-endopeptidase [Ramlibacter cellulosilyticus]
MPRWSRLACCLLAWSAAAWGQALPPEVGAALDAQGLPRDAVVMFVAPAEGGPARVEHRPDVAINPASVAKLATTYAALDLLGPNFTWTTPVYFDGPVRMGTLEGNLVLKGQGDPKLVIERLWLLLRRVRALGVHTIQGDIVLDRSAFQLPPHDPAAFDGQPLRPYNASPDALLVNFKTVTLTFTPDGNQARVHADPELAGVRWPATVPGALTDCGDWITSLAADFRDPARVRFAGRYPLACGEQSWQLAWPDPGTYPARAIAALWQGVGGHLRGQVREGLAPAGLKPAFEFASPPLAEVIRDINKFSNNVMAQQVFLTLSLQQRGTGTFEGSREVLRTWWRERFGGEPPVTENGSGLSRNESITARQLAQLLQGAWASPLMPDLAASLPLLGVDGTLRRQRQNVGLAHLKSGSLNEVSGVAGYVHGPQGRRYVLVAIANHRRASAVRPAVQALVEWAAHQP